MTRVKSLRFGSKKGDTGYAHRIHRSSKNRKKMLLSRFTQRQKKKHLALREEKYAKRELQKAKMWISEYGGKTKKVYTK